MLLQQITHEEFKETILPAVQKSLLRNPELVIEGWLIIMFAREYCADVCYISQSN